MQSGQTLGGLLTADNEVFGKMRLPLFAIPLHHCFGSPLGSLIAMAGIAGIRRAILSTEVGAWHIEIMVVAHIVAHIGAGRHMAHAAVGLGIVALVESVGCSGIVRRVALQAHLTALGF